jgi:hypothetical protein
MKIADAVAYNDACSYSRELWKTIQSTVGAEDDGYPGPLTAQAVCDWQKDNNLTPDGKVGPNTLELIRSHSGTAAPESSVEYVGFKRVPAVPYEGHGYDNLSLRPDVADKWVQLLDEVQSKGGYLTTAGGRRRLSSSVSANRSATSLHYLGIAFDLATYSGMIDPDEDPFIVCKDPTAEGYWNVYVKVEDGPEMKLKAFTKKMREEEVEGTFLDFTAMARDLGFRRIKSRSSFWSGSNYMGSEWWHFQDESGLEVRETKFGEELKRVWSMSDLEGTDPWKYRNRVWTGGYFK